MAAAAAMLRVCIENHAERNFMTICILCSIFIENELVQCWKGNRKPNNYFTM